MTQNKSPATISSTALTPSSVNAERFIPQHKQKQWDSFPSMLLVVTPCCLSTLTIVDAWLNDPSNRGSNFDLCTFNLLQYLPEAADSMRQAMFHFMPTFYHPQALQNFQSALTHIFGTIQSRRSMVMGLQKKLDSYAQIDEKLRPPPLSLEDIRSQQQTQGIQFSDDRILQTTPETVARVCDGIHSIVESQFIKPNTSIVKCAVELHKCLEMVCMDYMTKMRMLMDIERLQALNDLKAYDMYSCQFDNVEIAPPRIPLQECPGCTMGGMGRYCSYHQVLSLDKRFINVDSFPTLERLQGSKKASIIRTAKQFDWLAVNIKLKRDSKEKRDMEILVHLTVPGIAENRPLVSIGDLVRFRFEKDIEVVGNVREIQIKTERVMLQLPLPTNMRNIQPYIYSLITPKYHDFSLLKEKKIYRFDVRFGVFGSRAHDVFKKVTNAAITNSLDKVIRVIAPTPFLDNIRKKTERRPQIGISEWSHDNLNNEQKHAVFDIVRGNHGQAPYCIYGPPGTGKTMTMVESVVQILRYDGTKKILVCAPSDAACDVIAKRLLPVLPNSLKILRINWISRNPASLPPMLLSCSPMDSNGFFYIPPVKQMQEVSVIICQCFVAGCLDFENPTSPWLDKHFTHSFIDESSQSLEFESLIPLMKVNKDCSIILAGDPKQLGPTVRSSCASCNGLSLSLQERLMGLSLYKEDSNYCVITKLLDNYRSHNALLSIPSRLFYEGNLRCKASVEVTSACKNFELLHDGQNFPMMVYDVMEGKERSKIDTPSFYNVKECEAIVEIIQALLTSPNVQIHAGQIAVITCFRAQVLKMREILRAARLSSINVGVVEDFQGQETSVVLISTVLTEHQQRWMKDAKSGLGFMTDPKRFNVAITRASALCIIVGKVDYLENSGSYWTALIEHVRRNGSISHDCEGSGSPSEGKYDDFSEYGIDALMQKVQDLNLLGGGHAMDRYDLAMRGYYEDAPEWRVCL